MPSSRIHVYFMPGLAASSRIFEFIELPSETFEIHYLEWFLPDHGMSFEAYARKMVAQIEHDKSVLIGVSFGGMLVQEMAKFISPRKIIIISSIKQKSELPKRLLFAKYTKVHRLLPTGLVNNVELLAKYAFGETVNKRLSLYEQYLSLRDKYYLDWSIDKIVHWEQNTYHPDLVHIHGDKDAVFPVGPISDYIPVKGGTHTMILHRFKWFNERLPTIILE
ncbi:alpha/beta hydrolase [Flavobacteriaceae bacterium D16]|nr:alpha/beta hydrolase [Flavobacteriaceae bacterium D16]